MKDQEQKQKNPKNKKLLTYYLILGACILVIVAVALAVTLSVTLGGDNLTLDASDDTTEVPDEDDEDEDEDEEATDTSGDATFTLPVAEVDAVNTFGVYHNTTLNKYYLHTGIDFAADAGSEVYAVLDGTVESIVTDSRLTGTTITLSHENGLTTTYTFVEAVDTLSVGDSVSKGDVIATVAEAMGNEYKDGAHLHFEVFLNGESVDPELYLDLDSK